MTLESRVKRIKSYICKDQHSIHIIHLAYAKEREREWESPTIYTDAYIAHIAHATKRQCKQHMPSHIRVTKFYLREQPPPPSPSPTITTFLIRTMKEKVWHTILYAYTDIDSAVRVYGITYLNAELSALAFHIAHIYVALYIWLALASFFWPDTWCCKFYMRTV